MSAPKRIKTEPVDEQPKVKYSAKPFSAQSSRSDAAVLTEAEALEQLINLLKEAGKDGLSQETVMQRLGQRNIAVISEALNQLSKSVCTFCFLSLSSTSRSVDHDIIQHVCITRIV
jgi:hypothetical protein